MTGVRPNWIRRFIRRFVLSVAIAVPTMLAAWLTPWTQIQARLGWQPKFSGYITVVERDGRYWVVNVTERAWWGWTSVHSEPFDDAALAELERDQLYELVNNYEWPQATSNLPRADLTYVRSGSVPRWAKIVASDPTPYRLANRPGRYIYSHNESASGWPLRALRHGDVYATVMPPLDAQGRYNGTPQQVTSQYGYFELPRIGLVSYLPIWPGLFVDLLCFSMAWFIPFSALAAWRRRRRRTRGRCPDCGYDRRGLMMGAQCPECGMSDRA